MKIVLNSQIKGGKNCINTTRTGHRYPNPAWAAWRDSMVMQVKMQLPRGWKPLESPVNVVLRYFAGDKRRRDMPAVVDSLWHILEKAGVVKDDTLLWIKESSRDYDKDNPRAEIEFIE